MQKESLRNCEACEVFCFEDVLGWSRGDPGLKPSRDSETGTDLILLKETGHGGTGVPATQETCRESIFKNVLMPFTHMSFSRRMYTTSMETVGNVISTQIHTCFYY